LDSYFGYFHAVPGGVLATTGSSLYRFAYDGTCSWVVADLGVDGVVVRGFVTV
jgi:hypothetical protein